MPQILSGAWNLLPPTSHWRATASTANASMADGLRHSPQATVAELRVPPRGDADATCLCTSAVLSAGQHIMFSVRFAPNADLYRARFSVKLSIHLLRGTT